MSDYFPYVDVLFRVSLLLSFGGVDVHSVVVSSGGFFWLLSYSCRPVIVM